jgi:peptidoglycan/LPS O-acetylase OafA/YrhL
MGQSLAQRKDIQGLRGVAVLAVMLFHADKGWLPGGFVGVDIFLVISGFLITSLALRQMGENSFTFLSFYFSRIRRIVPAYLVLLAVVTLFMAVLLIPPDFSRYQKSVFSALYFNSNNFFAGGTDYFAPDTHELPLLHTWSLAIEMQFYLLLPVMLVFIPRRLLGPVLLVVCTLILGYSSFRLGQGYRQTEYFSLTARIPEFLMGSLLALYTFDKKWSDKTANLAAAGGLALILGSFWLITEEQAFPGLLALPPCLGAALLIAAGKSVLNRYLAIGALVWIGDLSYSLYLWHWPMLAGFRYFLKTYSLPMPALLAAVALTVACSYVSYRYAELRFRRNKSTASLLHTGLLASGALIAIWGCSLINAKLVDPLPEAMRRYAIMAEICQNKIVGDCLRGDKSADETILMLGDSHAGQLNHFADVVGNNIRAKIRVITGSFCVTIQGFDLATLSVTDRTSLTVY